MPAASIAWISSDRGTLRPKNEDRCCADAWTSDGSDGAWAVPLNSGRWWAAVADGMGGHDAGELASETVIAGLQALLDRTDEPLLGSLLEHVNDMVFEAMFTPSGRPGMGSTVAGVVVREGAAIFFNIGDSRAYLLRGNSLIQQSVDDALGAGTRAYRSHALTQSLGGSLRRTSIAPHIRCVPVSRQDLIILCSDGLTDMLADDEILHILARRPANPAQALVAAAIDAGGYDNITVIVAGGQE